MNRFLILLSTALVIAMLVGSCSGNNDQLYEELEYHLSRRQEVTALVENRLDSIKRCLDRTTDDERRYALCDTLVEQYMLFNSDSALKYIEKPLKYPEDSSAATMRTALALKMHISLPPRGIIAMLNRYLSTLTNRGSTTRLRRDTTSRGVGSTTLGRYMPMKM